jgi:hypothetical protein
MIFHPHVTEKQKQIIFGCLLGNSCAVLPKKSANYHLKIYGDLSDDHFEYKTSQLNHLSRKKNENKNYWISKSSELVSYCAEQVYKNKKKEITQKILESMTGIAFSIFFLDRSKFFDYYMETYMTNYSQESLLIFEDFCKSIEMSPKKIKRGNSVKIIFSGEDYTYWARVILTNLPKYAEKHLLKNI